MDDAVVDAKEVETSASKPQLESNPSKGERLGERERERGQIALVLTF